MALLSVLTASMFLGSTVAPAYAADKTVAGSGSTLPATNPCATTISFDARELHGKTSGSFSLSGVLGTIGGAITRARITFHDFKLEGMEAPSLCSGGHAVMISGDCGSEATITFTEIGSSALTFKGPVICAR